MMGPRGRNNDSKKKEDLVMSKNENIILVTGATGKQGGAVARQLLKAGYTVKAMTRKPQSESVGVLKALGAEIIQADFDDPASLDRALTGVWGVFAVQNTWEAGVVKEEEQGKRLAEAARKYGVSHYVYSSVGSANRKTGIPHFDNKNRVEQTVRFLGFPSYTILRPVFFMENFTSPWFLPGLMEGKLLMGVKPDTVLQMIAVDDIGKFGLLAFQQHQRLNGIELESCHGQENRVCRGFERRSPQAERGLRDHAGMVRPRRLQREHPRPDERVRYTAHRIQGLGKAD
jgi:uncharacterized protein YbjT (DUF2867 family)